MTDMSEEQLERYSRHILLADLGIEGQLRILKSKILIIGAGGLGAPAALYLAAAGVGTIGIADGDRVDLSNLQRQIIHHSKDIGKEKVISAEEKMTAINSDVKIETYNFHLFSSTIRDVIRKYDFVIDGTDSFAAKFLINDACIMENRPFSHGGILRFTGQTMTVIPGVSACYRCAFNEPPPAGAVPACSQAGVLGAVAGMLGTIQAAEALKYVAGIGKPLKDSLLSFDALEMNFRKTKMVRRKSCPVCGENRTITELVDEAGPLCAIKEGLR